jgi:hypothetical protein
MRSERDKQYAKLDRQPWNSIHFSVAYDDSKDFPWVLKMKVSGRTISQYRRKFAAQLEATRLDTIISEATR